MGLPFDIEISDIHQHLHRGKCSVTLEFPEISRVPFVISYCYYDEETVHSPYMVSHLELRPKVFWFQSRRTNADSVQWAWPARGRLWIPSVCFLVLTHTYSIRMDGMTVHQSHIASVANRMDCI